MRSQYVATIDGFLAASPEEVVGALVGNSERRGAAIEQTQVAAWKQQIDILKSALHAVKDLSDPTWGIAFEFPIPRRQRYIDTVLLARNVIFVLEFKTGEGKPSADALRQVEDYALDLADFHEPSQGKTLIPLVVASEGQAGSTEIRPQGVASPAGIPAEQLATALRTCLAACDSKGPAAPLTIEKWDDGGYNPVPTILEAANALFRGMQVRDIAHSHAGSQNLTQTTDLLVEAITTARTQGRKLICFVTGVPGAGKTLAGLNVVHDPRLGEGEQYNAVFLSGNGPLVQVVREALVRDYRLRNGGTRAAAERKVRTLIQNMHEFVREEYERTEPPKEHAIVFDEAQRAWNAARNAKKFKRDISEPQMVLDIMGRHRDWAVVVALVGGGQEIHEGEAGLAEWGKTLADAPGKWEVWSSREAITGGNAVAGNALFLGEPPAELSVRREPVLNLAVSVRSYRAQLASDWVNAVLAGDSVTARGIAGQCPTFPFVLTRSLPAAKRRLREMARGERRCGLVGSSGAERLRAEGFELSSGFRRAYPFEYWFLNSPGDVRSSYQLEVVASEFETQGLELDAVALCWGGDLLYDPTRSLWQPSRFKGTNWMKVQKDSLKDRIKNKYRVLLTRARIETVIWVPAGDPVDRTRRPEDFDATAAFLEECGVKLLPA
jgi:hypothetical protein